MLNGQSACTLPYTFTKQGNYSFIKSFDIDITYVSIFICLYNEAIIQSCEYRL